jgi:Glycosyl transferase family 11
VIIVNLIGGLGNQMFQYATARALSIKHKTPLRLDVSGFVNYGLHHGFELEYIFNCTTDIASKADLHGILGWQSSPIIRRIVSRPSMLSLRNKAFIIEPHFHYWSKINSLQSNSYLVGYWQSEQYFADIAERIRADFTFKLPMSKKNAELAKQINQVNAVSLHVRRGDYANNPKTTAIYGLSSLEYYQAAVQYIAGQVDRPHFFIFSDDIAWVKSNIKLNYPHQYVDNNYDTESYNDMRLMSMCKHHIIANSSFSWWGAWLNRNPEKMVVAPQKWFANELNVDDLFPRGWITL